jgi:hypothetical protein
VETPAAGDDRRRGIAADEGEPAPPLALDRLEDEAGFVADQTPEGGDGCDLIGHYLAPYGNDGVAGGQSPEVVPRRRQHERQR